MTAIYSHFTDAAVEQLRSRGWSDSEIEDANSVAAERGAVVQFVWTTIRLPVGEIPDALTVEDPASRASYDAAVERGDAIAHLLCKTSRSDHLVTWTEASHD